MWPFILPLLALVASVVFARSDAGRTRRKGLVRTFVIAGVLAVLGVLLMGIPGALVYGISLPWVSMFLGEGSADLGDGAWPAAILISMTWPFSLVLAYVAAAGPLRHRSRLLRAISWILIPYAMGVLLTLFAHL